MVTSIYEAPREGASFYILIPHDELKVMSMDFIQHKTNYKTGKQIKMYTIVKRRKTRRGHFTSEQQLSKKEIENKFPYWDGKSLLLKVDYRLGIVIEIIRQENK